MPSLFRIVLTSLLAFSFIAPGGARVFASDPPAGIIPSLVAAVNSGPILTHTSVLSNLSRGSAEQGKVDAESYAVQQLSDYGLAVRSDTFNSSGRSLTNIIAEKRGLVHPEKVVLLFAHIDANSSGAFPPVPNGKAHGANDNAAGVGAVLEAARAMAPANFENTVRFIIFDGEEYGYIGSRHYASSLAAAGETLVGGINLDMIAYPSAGKELFFVTDGKSGTVLPALQQSAREFPEPAAFDNYTVGTRWPFNSDPNRLSDQLPFWENGYHEVVLISEDVATSFGGDPAYHSSRDTVLNPDGSPRLDMTMAQSAAGISVAALSQLAVPADKPLWNPDSMAFYRQWERTDAPVALQQEQRTWFWGPQPIKTFREQYQTSGSPDRLVQYFDKGRLEENTGGGGWSTTAGLLVQEMITGRMQTGETSFSDLPASAVPVVGDASGSTSPSYRDFAGVVSHEVGRYPDQTSGQVTQTMSAGGAIGGTPTPPDDVRIGYYDPNFGHNVPGPFWGFMNSQGKIMVDGGVTTGPVMDWVRVLGYPITEPYWVKANVGGVEKDVLVQLFERRVLTYTPSNPPGWRVEMGNVGLHYLEWRYNR